MNQAQERVLELLKEIDEICSGQNIHYYLSGALLVYALRTEGFEDSFPEYEIAMPEEDVWKFISYWEAHPREDRYLESMLNNGEMTRVQLFYGDKNSTDLRVSSWGRYVHHGIQIKIEILRSRPAGKRIRKICDILERGWELYSAPAAFYGEPETNGQKLIAFLCRLRGNEKVSAWLFRFLLKPGRKKNPDFYRRQTAKNKRTKYSQKWFEETRQVAFEDVQLYVPGKCYAYIRKLQGSNWKKKEYAQVNPFARIVDADTPYEVFLQRMDEAGYDPKSAWEDVQQYAAASAEVKAVRKKRDVSWDILFLTGDRYQLWDYYSKRMLLLKELYRSGDRDAMRKELSEYHKATKKHYKNGYGFCIGKEIFDYYFWAMEYTENSDFVCSVKPMIPKRYWKPIRLVDYRGEKIKKAKEKKGLKRADENTIPAVAAYLERNAAEAVYLYARLSAVDTEEAADGKLWYDTDEEGINLAVLKDGDCLRIYSDTDTWNAEKAIRRIRKEQPERILAPESMLSLLENGLEGEYAAEEGGIFRITEYRSFDHIPMVDRVPAEEVTEVLAGLAEASGEEGRSDHPALADASDYRYGRVMRIFDEAGTRACTGTEAEYHKTALMGKTVTSGSLTGLPYGAIAESELARELTEEECVLYACTTQERRMRLLEAMECEQTGRYVEMRRKDQPFSANAEDSICV